MYIASEIAGRIKSRAKEQNIALKVMLADLELGVNTISSLAKGTQLSSVALARIADYLHCSVDYLLGRTDEPSKILLPEGDKRKLIQKRILTMTDEELSRMEDIINYVLAKKD